MSEVFQNGMVPAMAGAMLGQITYGRLLRLIQTGEVRGQRVDGRWFVDPADLARWKRKETHNATARTVAK